MWFDYNIKPVSEYKWFRHQILECEIYDGEYLFQKPLNPSEWVGDIEETPVTVLYISDLKENRNDQKISRIIIKREALENLRSVISTGINGNNMKKFRLWDDSKDILVNINSIIWIENDCKVVTFYVNADNSNFKKNEYPFRGMHRFDILARERSVFTRVDR